jgi:hypothetical protein
VPTTAAPPSATATPPPTSSVVDGWLVYQNEALGYEFSYPPEASISSSGPDGYPNNDVPPNIDFDYFDLLYRLYQDHLCVVLSSEMGFMSIRAPEDRGGNFVTCGVTGYGDVDLVRISETVVIAGQTYTAGGNEARARDAAATLQLSVLNVYLDDGTHIQYGGDWARVGAAQEGHSAAKEAFRLILGTFRQTEAAPACAADWSQLYPARFAVVTGGPNDPPNRVRAAPDTNAEFLTQIYPGDIVVVLEGPVCAGSLVFWKVQSDAIPGGEGWTAEGDGVEYYLVPYQRPRS